MPPLVDKHGKPLMVVKNPPQKKAFGLINSIYEYPNAGRFHFRQYTSQDTELSINQYNRDMVLRLSREMVNKQPWIYAAIKLLSSFSVGDQYQFRYTGDNSAWGKVAEDYINQVFYFDCCSRGPNYDFVTVMSLLSEKIDEDGDILLVFGKDKFQLIPAHRIRSLGTGPYQYAAINSVPQPGPYQNTTVSDGVVYDMNGSPVAYAVQNPGNMVNSAYGDSNGDSQYVSTRNARLVYAPSFPDKGRGIPTISRGIIQAVSVEELENYLMEKAKIQSMYAVIEKTPEGEGPLEEEEAYRRSAGILNQLQGFNVVQDTSPYSGTQGLRVVDNPAIKYISCAGGDIKFPQMAVTDKDSASFLTRLEKGVLSTLGVPHSLLFSPDDISGKMNSSVVEIFNGAIRKRQQLLDFHGKFIIGWALSKAIQSGELPPNNNEILTQCFEFTHPQPFSIDDTKVRQSDLAEYEAGVRTLDDIAKRNNTTAEKIINQREKESILFFNSAKRIAEQTGVELPVVIQSLREDIKQQKPQQQ